MPCEDCVGIENCNTYNSLKNTVREGRSEADFIGDTASCRRGYGCSQKTNYERSYRGE